METFFEMVSFWKDILLEILTTIPEVLSWPVVFLIIAIIYRKMIIKVFTSSNSDTKLYSEKKKSHMISDCELKLNQFLGQAYATKGAYDEAIIKYNEAIKEDPEDATSYIGLGNAYYKKRMFNEAIASLIKAVEIKPFWADARCNLGAALSLAGLYDKAINEFLQAIEINPNYTSAHYGLGISYVSIRDYEKAKEQIKVLNNLDKELAEKILEKINQAQ